MVTLVEIDKFLIEFLALKNNIASNTGDWNFGANNLITTGTIDLSNDTSTILIGEGGLTGLLGSDMKIGTDGTRGYLQIGGAMAFVNRNPKLSFGYQEITGAGFVNQCAIDTNGGIIFENSGNTVIASASAGTTLQIQAGSNTVYGATGFMQIGYAAGNAFIQTGANTSLSILPQGNINFGQSGSVTIGANKLFIFGGKAIISHNGVDLLINPRYSGNGSIHLLTRTLLGTPLTNYAEFGTQGDLIFQGTAKITGIKKAISTKTANYDVLYTDDIILCNTNTFTITLLSSTANTTGKIYEIKNIGPGVITVDTNDAATIDGDASIELIEDEVITVINDGTNWFII